MAAPRYFLPFALAALASAAGCGGDEGPGTGDDAYIAETDDLFGDDRVSQKLKGDLRAAPRTYPELEKLFGIGRECANEDSKEIFVVEESTTRAGGHLTETDQLMPRAVVTGCNTDRSNPDSAINSFSLMVALFASPDAPNAAEGDPMILSPVEVMALDTKTGLYNFYVFEDAGEGKPGTINRIRLMPDDSVVRYTLAAGSKAVVEEPVADRACNNCHANMGPLMNELTEPWTNWVSTHKQLPESKLGGETKSIVNEAISLDGKHKRSSLANDLEPTMRAAVRVWVDGLPDVPRSGFGQAVLDGDQPNGLPGLLQSVFCQTELNFVSASETVPVELFVDPAAVAGGSLSAPSSYAIDVFPTQMPVRSEMDKRLEKFLMKQKYLSVKTVTAIRLVDDAMDIFSDARCGLLPQVLEGLPSAPADVDAHVRKVLAAQVDKLATGPRAKYMQALLDTATASAALKEAQTAYLGEVSQRYAEDTAKLETPEGREELKKRVAARKAAAKKMFPGDKSPLPVLDPDEPSMGAGGGGGGGGGGGEGGAGGGGGDTCAHDVCTAGDKLEATCSPCATAVCEEDSYCCESAWDETCLTIAKGVAACGC